jgi:ABC-type branched-subunit amino acid transport system substrate-binding protein
MLHRRDFIQRAGASASVLAAPGIVLAAPQQIIGLSLPATGIQAEIASELLVGYELALKASRSNLAIKVLNDESKEELTARNITALSGDPSVIATSGIVGTPHAIAALPIAVAKGLPVIGIRSGADSLRQGKPGVFHLRASFGQEITKIVGLIKNSGMSGLVAIYSNDAFGKGVVKQLETIMTAQGVKLVGSVAAERDGSDMEAATAKAAEIVKAQQNAATGVFLLLITKPMNQAAMLLRTKHSLVMPLYAMSFVATKSTITSTENHLAGLGLVTTFPLPAGGDPLAMLYRSAVANFGKPDMLYSLTTLEGYFYGMVISAAASNSVNREAVQRKLSVGLMLGNNEIKFDELGTGYRYTQIVRKSRFDGSLKA